MIKEKISNLEISTILICFLVGSTIIISPSASAAQDSWLAMIIASIGGIILISIYTWIYKLNENKNLVQILKQNFGKTIGTIISVLYIWYFLHLVALVFRNFGEYFLLSVFTETPILFIIVCFGLVVLYTVIKGIEVVGRISGVFTIILAIVIVFTFFALIPEYEFANFKPFLSKGIGSVIKSAFPILTFPFGETVVFLMVLPHVNNSKKTNRSLIWAMIIFAILILLVITRNIMVLGADMITRDVFPSHIVFRLMPGMDLDPLLDVNLVIAGIVKISICLYAGIKAVAQLFNFNNYKPLILPITAFTISLSIWVYSNVIEMTEWATKIYPIYVIPFQIVIPILLLIISLVKKKKSSKIRKSN